MTQMRVRMLVSMEGPAVSRKHGQEIDMNDGEAVRLINAGFAERVTPPGREKIPTESKTVYRKAKRAK